MRQDETKYVFAYRTVGSNEAAAQLMYGKESFDGRGVFNDGLYLAPASPPGARLTNEGFRRSASYGTNRDTLAKYTKSKAYAALQGDEIPTDLKASLYHLWGLVKRGSDEEFIKFYSKMY